MEITHQSVTVLVLAAGSQSSPAAAFGFSCQDAGFLNVGTKLAVERIVSFFKDKQNIHTLLAVADESKKIFQLKPFANVTLHGAGFTDSVCGTVMSALDSVVTEWCLINPVTAVPTSHLSTDGAIYFGQDQIPRENWSAMTMVACDQPIFHSKTDKVSYGLPSFPFTGRIYAQTHNIRSAINDLNPGEDSDLLGLAALLFHRGQVKIRYERWLDAGHSATYSDSKLLSISSRFFNSLTYNKTTNTISKRSPDADKLKLEGRFFDEAPPKLKRYFPMVINSSEAGNLWELEMEYIGYPSLAEIFLYGQAGFNNWRRIIRSLCQVFDAFYSGPPLCVEDASWLYSHKTIQRQQALENLLEREPTHPLQRIYDCPYNVNGISHPPLRDAFLAIVEQLTRIEKDRPLFIGHGDLCFNNILADPLFGSLKLIDPKAAMHLPTGKCGLIDPLYDLAKLNHSFCGLYDCVVNGLYRLDQDSESCFTFLIYKPVNFRTIVSMFQDMLLLERVDEAICTLATANLFLSMLPLHSEDPDRMVALSFIGSSLLYHGNLEPLLLNP
jgi:hypothetical protein